MVFSGVGAEIGADRALTGYLNIDGRRRGQDGKRLRWDNEGSANWSLHFGSVLPHQVQLLQLRIRRIFPRCV
jgi:hypothetical protein